MKRRSNSYAGVAELADAMDLKSIAPLPECTGSTPVSGIIILGLGH